MKPKFLFLMFVLSLILLAPAVVTSCVDQVNATEVSATADDSQAALSADTTYSAPEANAEVKQDGGLIGTDMFSFQSIAVLVLGLLSTIFATLWRRASNVIHQVDAALKDGKIDKVELNRIIQAWKG